MVIDNVAKHLPADGSVWITIIQNITMLLTVEKKIEFILVACVLDHKFN